MNSSSNGGGLISVVAGVLGNLELLFKTHVEVLCEIRDLLKVTVNVKAKKAEERRLERAAKVQLTIDDLTDEERAIYDAIKKDAILCSMVKKPIDAARQISNEVTPGVDPLQCLKACSKFIYDKDARPRDINKTLSDWVAREARLAKRGEPQRPKREFNPRKPSIPESPPGPSIFDNWE